MAVVVQRRHLTKTDKAFIIEQLTVSSNTDPPVVIRPFQVTRIHDDEEGGTVRLPFAFYQELRAYGQHNDWPEFPNDIHHQRFIKEWQFTGQLRDYQVEVWAEMVAILQKRHSVLLGAFCGFGKSVMTVYTASKVQLPTLILYHISPLGRSWPQSFKSASNAVVCHLNEDPFNPHAHIYICTVGLALSEKFPLDPKRVGLLVVDESHVFAAPCRIFSYLRFEPKYVLNLTATPDRPDGLGAMLGLFHGRTTDTPCSVVRISQRAFTVYRQTTGLKPRMITNSQGLDWQEVKKSLLTHPKLISLICDWVVANPHKKILISTVQISQLKAIAEELTARGEQSVGTFHGNADSYDECRVLVAIDKKCGLGFDDANTCRNYGGRRLDMIILGWTIKDKGATEQLVGRMRCENGVVVDLIHASKVFENHWRNREEWYLSRKGRVVEVNGPCRLP